MAPEEVPAPSAGDEVTALIMGEEGNLRLIARRMTRCSADADDLVQETLLRAIRSRGSFRVGTSVRAWTKTILRRLFLTNALQAKLRRTTNDSALGAPTEMKESRSLSGAYSEPLDLERFAHDFDDRTQRALERLNSKYRIAFMLSAVEDLTYGEIAARVGVPVGTVMSRVHRARVFLRTELLRDPEYAAIARRLRRESR